MKKFPSNKVYIVGAGPGDPELLTVKAKRLLESYAEVVIHDRLISPEILAIIPNSVQKIFAGKEPDFHHMNQDEVNQLMVDLAGEGKKIVRLKGGDPFIFGRGGEEAEFLQLHGIEFEIIPGITSALGAAAQQIVPLTYRNISESVIFITGHNCGDPKPSLDYDFLARTNTTIVIYMGVKNMASIAEKLISSGKNPQTSCLAISQATYESAKHIYSTLDKIAENMAANNIKNPALVYIGDVVKISQKLSALITGKSE